MATLRTVTVKASGGDYTSLNGALAGEAGDLPSLDRRLDTICDAITDTTAVAMSGYTQDATRYVRIAPATGAEAGSAWRTSGAYTLSITSGTYAITTGSMTFTRVERIQIYCSQTAAANIGLNETWDGVVVKLPGGASGAIGFRSAAYGPGTLETVRNCIVWNNGSAQAFSGQGTNTLTFYNCTAHGTGTGFGTSKTSHIAKNCVATDTTGFSGTWDATSDYNASVDGTGPGAHSVTSTLANMHFADAANGNFTIDATSSLAGVGTNLSSSFTTDVNGATRTQWDIGADGFVGSGASMTASLSVSTSLSVTQILLHVAAGATFSASTSLSAAPSNVLKAAATVLNYWMRRAARRLRSWEQR